MLKLNPVHKFKTILANIKMFQLSQ